MASLHEESSSFADAVTSRVILSIQITLNLESSFMKVLDLSFHSNLNHQIWMSVEEIMTKIQKLLKSECSRSLALCRVVTWCRLVTEALCHDSCPWWRLVTVLNYPKMTPFALQLVLINSKSFPSMNWAKNMYLTYIINHKDKEMKIITS